MRQPAINELMQAPHPYTVHELLRAPHNFTINELQFTQALARGQHVIIISLWADRCFLFEPTLRQILNESTREIVPQLHLPKMTIDFDVEAAGHRIENQRTVVQNKGKRILPPGYDIAFHGDYGYVLTLPHFAGRLSAESPSSTHFIYYESAGGPYHMEFGIARPGTLKWDRVDTSTNDALLYAFNSKLGGIRLAYDTHGPLIVSPGADADGCHAIYRPVRDNHNNVYDTSWINWQATLLIDQFSFAPIHSLGDPDLESREPINPDHVLPEGMLLAIDEEVGPVVVSPHANERQCHNIFHDALFNTSVSDRPLTHLAQISYLELADLPDNLRLADHPDYGRVVVGESDLPWNDEGECDIFRLCSIDESPAGAIHDRIQESELSFIS
ncbi:hypothetical protein N24_1806 [Corynebacterium suranareeae]|uniref:Uncharacterized protein n=1 Tax=Corynebacterium suranareeae TaxID=2506452 RepID=A0A161JNT6_9CORY|nr:hypothetical protein [Corynebacterium suranareeae]BAU96068.1 hypothetical protein N24_1806 [Corynebacterium suranareeae]